MYSRRNRPDVQKSFVGFFVQDVHYAVPISAVRSIVNPLQITPMPKTPPAIAGVAHHRGEVIPIVLMRRHLGYPDRERQAREKWILVEAAGRILGLWVDSVSDVFGTLGAGMLQPPAIGGHEERGITGVVHYQDRLTYVLDLTIFEQLALALNHTQSDSSERKHYHA